MLEKGDQVRPRMTGANNPKGVGTIVNEQGGCWYEVLFAEHPSMWRKRDLVKNEGSVEENGASRDRLSRGQQDQV